MSKEKFGANMHLFTTYWGQHKTFKLMPLEDACPYLEIIYDPTVQMLVVLSKNMKQNYELLPKLDDDGEMMHAKKPKKNGKGFKEERRLMEVPQEFYVIDRAEQEEIIELFAVNSTEYDFKQYLDIKPPSEILQKEGAGKGEILDAKGNKMVVEK